ncbi:UNVERIFIED_ORG: hypothetical protein FHU01_3203 [Citrobacter freundii]
MAHKAKATWGGRQWHNTKFERIQNTRLLAGGQCVRGADLHCRSTRDTQNISLQNAVGHAVRKAKNSAGGSTDAIFSGYQVVIESVCYQTPDCGDDFLLRRPILVRTLVFRNCSMWKFLTFSCSISCEISCEIFLAKKSFNLGMVRPLLTFCRWSSLLSGAKGGYCSGCSLALRRWRRFSSCSTFSGKNPACLFSGADDFVSGCFSVIHQPFGSIPCRRNSARASSLNQFPKLTPSRSAALLSCWRSSGFIRIWKVGDHPSPLGDLSRLMLDMYVRNLLAYDSLGTYVNTYCSNMTTPRTVGAVTGRLTKPLIEVTIMAGTQHTETRPNCSNKFSDHCFTWRFLALSAAQPCVITIEATSEQEARQQSPAGCVMVLVARIRKEVRHA